MHFTWYTNADGGFRETVDEILVDTEKLIQTKGNLQKCRCLNREQQITCSLSALQIPNLRIAGPGKQGQINNVHRLWGGLYKEITTATRWL